MPFIKDTGVRENPKYCSYCFNHGKLCYEGTDVKEFKKAMINEIVARGEPRWKARFFACMAGFAPRWKGEGRLSAFVGGRASHCADSEVK
jgi:hypothetical protein